MTPEERGAIKAVAIYDQAMAEAAARFPDRSESWLRGFVYRDLMIAGLIPTDD